jgi:hypothetical protein
VYFEDLAPCTYHTGHLDSASWAVPLRAVGWLEHPHSVSVGSVPAELAARLAKLVAQTRTHFSHLTFRGVHRCSLCATVGASTGAVGWSQENLIVPGEGEVFAAPGGIVHYVADHSYAPPARFVVAVMACPDCDSLDYLSALRSANAGRDVPFESYETSSRRDRQEVGAGVKFRQALGMPLKQATRAQVVAAARQAWPEESFAGEASSIRLGSVRVAFDASGRVSDVSD